LCFALISAMPATSNSLNSRRAAEYFQGMRRVAVPGTTKTQDPPALVGEEWDMYLYQAFGLDLVFDSESSASTCADEVPEDQGDHESVSVRPSWAARHGKR